MISIDKLHTSMIKKIKVIFFDFDGVFTDNFVYVDSNGIESVRCYRGDGIGIKLVKSIKLSAIILSSEKNKVVSKRAKKLNIKCFQNISDKKNKIIEWAKKNDFRLEQIAFVGNDLNDLDALKVAGIPIITNDCVTALSSYNFFKTKSNGGMGAVREVCDIFYKAINK